MALFSKRSTIINMKFLSLYACFFSILFFSSAVSAKLIVVSDIDDTIRRTETLNPGRGLLNLMKNSVPAYEGIRKIYWDLWATRTDITFYYVSSSIKDIYDADDWLSLAFFPVGQMIQKTRDQFFDISEKKYKVDAIVNYIKNEPPETEYYFLGDTTFLDEEIYKEVIKRLNLKHTTIFIHDVKGDIAFKSLSAEVTIHPNVIYYISEMDLIDIYRFPEVFSWISLNTELTILKEYYLKRGMSEGYGANLFLQLRQQYCTNGKHAFKECLSKAEIETDIFMKWYYRKYLYSKNKSLF
jgi:hypothetical protein